MAMSLNYNDSINHFVIFIPFLITEISSLRMYNNNMDFNKKRTTICFTHLWFKDSRKRIGDPSSRKRRMETDCRYRTPHIEQPAADGGYLE